MTKQSDIRAINLIIFKIIKCLVSLIEETHTVKRKRKEALIDAGLMEKLMWSILPSRLDIISIAKLVR